MQRESSVKKSKGIWVPHDLTGAQKKMIMECRSRYLINYNRGRLRKLNSIITCDETWIRFYTLYPGNKRQWVFDDEDFPKVLKQINTRNKRMFTIFFNSTGVVPSQFQELGY